jgi:hypothetical protein
MRKRTDFSVLMPLLVRSSDSITNKLITRKIKKKLKRAKITQNKGVTRIHNFSGTVGRTVIICGP